MYREDWGEALTNKSLPVICSVNLQSGSVSVLEGVPSDVSPGQVRTESLQPSNLTVYHLVFIVYFPGSVGSLWPVCFLCWLVPRALQTGTQVLLQPQVRSVAWNKTLVVLLFFF